MQSYNNASCSYQTLQYKLLNLGRRILLVLLCEANVLIVLVGLKW